MRTERDELSTILVTDCGSTTTKALLFERKEDRWRQTFRGEAPTTVEEPVADVTVGALNAFQEVQELSGRQVLSEIDGAHPFSLSERDPTKGIDLYLSTSSAGGGLQMLVAGVVKTLSTQSAERAALGAGAIVMDAISADDGRSDHERIRRIRHIKPDIVLVTGGVDGGSRTHVVEMAEILVAASPRPRFGETLKLPVIYAGNKEAAEEVRTILSSLASVVAVENVRPTLESENLGPAREAIHEFFLSHVMSHSPGYGKLLSWTPVPVMPTPAAVGDMVLAYAHRSGNQVLCVDIGGATTDVFTVFRGTEGAPLFHRSVSANLGMSYSIANVLVEAGVEGIRRWLPYELDEHELRDRLRNKMVRPTSIPQTIEDLWLEQAVCREALSLSLKHHRSLAIGISAARAERTIADVFSTRSSHYELVNLMTLDLVIGSGGVLSHAPNRMQAAAMMLDGFALEGITEIAVDSIFMLPHLGVLNSIHPEAAQAIFDGDCLVRLGTAVAPVFRERRRSEEPLAEVIFNGELVAKVQEGNVVTMQPRLREGELKVQPASGVDVGGGPGREVVRHTIVGPCGIILDGRNRPIKFLPHRDQVSNQKAMFANLGLL